MSKRHFTPGPPPQPPERIFAVTWDFASHGALAQLVRGGRILGEREQGKEPEEKELNEVWLQKETVLCVIP